ncbi:XRE family transcriptional regulator [Frondihabitans sucicola]|uniref:XRE family transcriptional regulator n=1 Tax=Frondihabitans sucicola TaxID=1268041 RepID=A0ABM8GJ82_9MICO|nr:helix-turn-helix domain-containing protein [Frondihabitans sucicola]BDZ48421.1 XRE family transcriptional regulator [Frondihabitans sucicola]
MRAPPDDCRGTQSQSLSIQEDPVTSLDTAIDQQALSVGRRIRELRRARDLTLVQLAAAAQLSHPFLSQLERGLARPSMVSLERIARALGSSQVELLAPVDVSGPDASRPGIEVIRASDGSRGPYGQAEGRLLVHGDRPFHPMILVGTSADPGDFFSHAEDEFLHVMEGSAVVDFGDGEPRVLSVGDSVYFVGGTPHRWWAAGDAGYRVFVVKEKPETL